MRVIENQRPRVRRERLALLDDLLGERMTQPVQIRILDILSATVWPRVNLLIGEGILDERESALPILKLGIRLEVKPRHLPQPGLVLVENLTALPQVYTQLFVNLFIEGLQEFLTGLLYAV